MASNSQRRAAARRERYELAGVTGRVGELDGRAVDDKHVKSNARGQTADRRRTDARHVHDRVSGHEVVRGREGDRFAISIDRGRAIEIVAERQIVVVRNSDVVFAIVDDARLRRPVIQDRITGRQTVVEHLQGVRAGVGGQHLVIGHGAGGRRRHGNDRDVVAGVHRGRHDVGGDLGLDRGVGLRSTELHATDADALGERVAFGMRDRFD